MICDLAQASLDLDCLADALVSLQVEERILAGSLPMKQSSDLKVTKQSLEILAVQDKTLRSNNLSLTQESIQVTLSAIPACLANAIGSFQCDYGLSDTT